MTTQNRFPDTKLCFPVRIEQRARACVKGHIAGGRVMSGYAQLSGVIPEPDPGPRTAVKGCLDHLCDGPRAPERL